MPSSVSASFGLLRWVSRKVEAVMSWERPKSVFKIRSFLGLAEYYKRFIDPG